MIQNFKEEKELADICCAPDCGAFISDDSKPCEVCQGRGFNQSLTPGKVKVPWTNSMWAEWRDDEEDEANRLSTTNK